MAWYFKGAMDKKAGGVIWLPFLQFLSNFNETLSISSFFRGHLNRALRSDLTPLHSAHFTTAKRGLCTNFPTLLFLKDKKVGKLVQSARCAVQNVHCAHPVSQKIVSKNVMKS